MLKLLSFLHLSRLREYLEYGRRERAKRANHKQAPLHFTLSFLCFSADFTAQRYAIAVLAMALCQSVL